jgi:osmotically-inducible protein OsmY
MRILVILIITGTLTACSGLMIGGGSAGSRSTVERDRSSSQAADATISERVRAQYAADPGLGKSGIAVKTSAGLVTLSGTVASYAAREAAEKLAMATDGVRAVDNRINVDYAK